ncbi:MAG: hypothetical protein AB9919_08710 [Geobacteraceae bacterium]
MKKYVRKIDLNNSLTVQVYDTTRRYYEDYHLVRLEIECEVAVKEEFFTEPESFARARMLLGESVCYHRTVEKMGVPFAEIDAAREGIISCFISTALPYLASESFPRKFVVSELQKASAAMHRSAV